jgi:hypothetical protein
MKTVRTITSTLMPYEHKNAPVASQNTYKKRVWRSFLFAFGLLTVSLLIGTIGYYHFGQDNLGTENHLRPSPIDAFLCASMILTGMGPIGAMDSNAGKIFSALYAIYSGVAFLSSVAIFFSPILHRFLHLMHMDVQENE